MSVNDTLSERGGRYGPFEQHARITQELKRVVINHPGYDRLSDDQKEALSMIFHKVGRIINGNPNYADSWHDIAGYATLVEQALSSQQQPLTSAGSPDTMDGQ